jgi:iron complex outermembrane receptor protein
VDSYRDQRAAITGAGKEIDAYATGDLAYRVFLPWDTTFSAAVENITDQDPPLARLDLNYDPFTASALGRTIKFNVVKKF